MDFGKPAGQCESAIREQAAGKSTLCQGRWVLSGAIGPTKTNPGWPLAGSIGVALAFLVLGQSNRAESISKILGQLHAKAL